MSNKTPTWQPAYLAALEETGSKSHAAKAAGVGRQTVYDREKADLDFFKKCHMALEIAADNLEAEARRRAIEGDEVPVFSQGKVVGHRTKKSDQLLIFGIRTTRERTDKMEHEILLREAQAVEEETTRDFMEGRLSLDELALRGATGAANRLGARGGNGSR